MVCTSTPSEDSDQLKYSHNGTRAFVVRMGTFKSLGIQRVENDGFDQIEWLMPKLI